MPDTNDAISTSAPAPPATPTDTAPAPRVTEEDIVARSLRHLRGLPKPSPATHAEPAEQSAVVVQPQPATGSAALKPNDGTPQVPADNAMYQQLLHLQALNADLEARFEAMAAVQAARPAPAAQAAPPVAQAPSPPVPDTLASSGNLDPFLRAARADLGEHADDGMVRRYADELLHAAAYAAYEGQEGADPAQIKAAQQRLHRTHDEARRHLQLQSRLRASEEAREKEYDDLRRQIAELKSAPLRQQAISEMTGTFGSLLASDESPHFAAQFGGLQSLAQDLGVGSELAAIAAHDAAAVEGADPRAEGYAGEVARRLYALQSPAVQWRQAMEAAGTAASAVRDALAASMSDPHRLALLAKMHDAIEKKRAPVESAADAAADAAAGAVAGAAAARGVEPRAAQRAASQPPPIPTPARQDGQPIAVTRMSPNTPIEERLAIMRARGEL